MKAQTIPSSQALHQRALDALPAVRSALDNSLTDYPSARFRNVHARLVRSVYSDDEGQSDKVPWTHRGGLVLVFCGEINAKNKMGGYGGWQSFAFRPAQTDIVTTYDFGNPRRPKQENIAARDMLILTGHDRFDDERVNLLCTTSGDGEGADPTDLSSKIAYGAS